MQSDVRNYWTRQLSRRGFVRSAAAGVAGLTAASLVGCSGDSPAATPAPSPTSPPSPTPLPPPETRTIRLGFGACDAPFMVSERYLQDEGFTDIQLQPASSFAAGGVAQLTDGKADLVVLDSVELTSAADGGKSVIGIGPVHPGCFEIWAPPSVAMLKDVRGHTVVVNAKTLNDHNYAFLAIALKNAGVDPSEVNFVVDPAAPYVKLFLDGKSDLLLLGALPLVQAMPNLPKWHVVWDQAMEAPWSQEACCNVATSADWFRANPVAARRALRAIYRAADSLPKDRGDAAKVATDKGLFGGPANVELVRTAVNMVPYDWRNYDVAESMRFHAKLFNAVGLLKLTPDEVVTKVTDLRLTKELATELKR